MSIVCRSSYSTASLSISVPLQVVKKLLPSVLLVMTAMHSIMYKYTIVLYLTVC